ncbi:MAG: 5-methylthioadenosine/S-adenosylhomocysteine deaminase [Firmicutes bacterium]|nr:5-methylthioadenosine/S-adenosylhomocysteine deaminase [Bacillota bacterium]
MTKILIKNPEVFGSDGIVRQADIAIDGVKIAYVGNVPSEWKPDRVIEGAGRFAIPGFVNTHTHAAMTLFRSYADDMRLMDWLENKIWPAEANLTGDDVYWGTQLAIAEMLRTGATTFADMYFFMDDVARAVESSGIRAVLARGLIGVTPDGTKSLAENEDFFHKWHNQAEGRITVMMGPHAPYTCPPEYLKKVVNVATRLGAELHIHLAETKNEVEDCIKLYGKSPIKLMEDLGVLQCGVLAAHCVHVDADDIEIMQKYKVRVAHNPGSNMKLASGVAPVTNFLKAGICVGLGTDGAASNNNLDMLEEIRLTTLLQKVHTMDPEALPAKQAVLLGTGNGAKALGLEKITGSLTPGYHADITLLETNAPHWFPKHDRISLLAYAANAGDVHTVMVNGRILVDNHQLTTIDEEKMLAEVQARGMRLVAKFK